MYISNIYLLIGRVKGWGLKKPFRDERAISRLTRPEHMKSHYSVKNNFIWLRVLLDEQFLAFAALADSGFDKI